MKTFLGTWPGRLLVLSAAIRVALGLLRSAIAPSPFVDALATVASVVLLASLGYLALRLLVQVKRRLLWRVRRKLILSYIFIGFVPALLIVAFFLFSGFLLFLNVSSYLFKRGFDDVVDETAVIAEATVAELERGGGPAAATVLQRKVTNARARHPELSLALVGRPIMPGTAADRAPVAPSVAGRWTHLDPPGFLPGWVVANKGFSGVLALEQANGATHLTIRSVAVPGGPDPSYGLVVDLPLDGGLAARLRESTGILAGNVSPVDSDDTMVRPIRGRIARGAATAVRAGEAARTSDPSSAFRRGVTFVDYTDWLTGKRGKVGISTDVSIREIYDRISAAQSRFGSITLGDLFLVVLVAIAILFLIIECVALVMGFALAKSITGSIHSLFTGTERVRVGDFTHRITVTTNDQLGELAGSFNTMTASIEGLLVEAAEKKRLEEELRIARQIQMSLLPRGPLDMPGLTLTALCVPAREVGGDYYDYFPLGDDRVGLLIADVSGKGTSAALYMAELKGLMLSLSQIHHSPKALLIEVNRIIADNLDSRSFITMAYLVIDLRARTLMYARAGHTPLIYLPSASKGAREARVLTPDGMVVGIRIAGLEKRFVEMLEEYTVPIATGDLFVLYTDGITEAMNHAADLFGDSRLSQIVEQHGDLPPEELRERILREVESFVDGADQHDDMTMILINVEERASAQVAMPLEKAVPEAVPEAVAEAVSA